MSEQRARTWRRTLANPLVAAAPPPLCTPARAPREWWRVSPTRACPRCGLGQNCVMSHSGLGGGRWCVQQVNRTCGAREVLLGGVAVSPPTNAPLRCPPGLRAPQSARHNRWAPDPSGQCVVTTWRASADVSCARPATSVLCPLSRVDPQRRTPFCDSAVEDPRSGREPCIVPIPRWLCAGLPASATL